MNNIDIKKECFEIRNILIKSACESGESAHLGGSLSMIELLNYVYGHYIKKNKDGRFLSTDDIFILSKGHCVLGLYSVLNYYGFISNEKMKTFQCNGSDLIAHPVKNYSIAIDSSNGSLGQGLSFGLGNALGIKKKGGEQKVIVMLGDGECNEGAIWESAATAAEFKVNNLIAIVDINRHRNDGLNNTYSGTKMQNVWSSFGWNTIKIDGHDNDQIHKAFQNIKKDMPTVILANTIKGAGVDFMENNNEWHHNRITKKVFDSIDIKMDINNEI